MTRRLFVVAIFYPLAAAGMARTVTPVAMWLLFVAFLIVHLSVRAFQHATDVWFESVSLLVLIIIATVFCTDLGDTFHLASAASVLALGCLILLAPVAIKYWKTMVRVCSKKTSTARKSAESDSSDGHSERELLPPLPQPLPLVIHPLMLQRLPPLPPRPASIFPGGFLPLSPNSRGNVVSNG